MRVAALIAVMIAIAVAASSAEPVMPPLPPGVSADAADVGPADAPFRMDFAFARYRGCADGCMELQVLHHALVIVGNDYTLETLKAATDAHHDDIATIRAKKINGWMKYREELDLVAKEFADRYTQFQRLDEPAFFTVTSKDDPAYAAGQHPAKAARFAMPRGNYRDEVTVKGRVATAGTLLANYSYLTLPTPMKAGCTYEIAQGDGRATTFLFHEDLTISRALKVNQTGYAPRATRKYAYLGAWQGGVGPIDLSAWDGKPFEVVDANTRAVVHSGTIALVAKDPKVWIQKNERSGAGEDLYELDLSGLKAQGEFYIRVAGLGRSWPFHHDQEGIGRGFFIHLRGLFHQRGGHELAPEYTGWPRPLAHAAAYVADFAPETAYCSLPVDDFKAIRFFMKEHPDLVEWGPPGRGGVGGWYDAADFDRRWYHYDVVFDLLLAYELNPAAFTDGQEHTYESANGVPDIIDEAAWGLRVWRNSQDEKGGIAGHLESPNHPDSTSAMPDGRPHHDPAKVFVSRRTRGCSYTYAGAAAHLARLLQKFNPDEAKGWLDSAKRAYDFALDEANTYADDNYAGTGKRCEESKELIIIAGSEAGLELYLTTKEKRYLDAAVALYPQAKPLMKWPLKYVHQDYWWAFSDDAGIPAAIHDEVRKRYLANADEVEARTRTPGFYRSPIDQKSPWPTTWGKASGTQDAQALAMGYGLAREQKYLDGIALACDWVQGCNPLGQSWTSGIGYTYPWCFFSGESEEDGILDPVPGITVFGVTGGISIGARRHGYNLMDWDDKKHSWTVIKRLQPAYAKVRDEDLCPHIPYWRGFVMDYHDAPDMQEYTVQETVAPSMLAYAVLLGEGWTPSARLKALKPREPRYVFGQWPTP